MLGAAYRIGLLSVSSRNMLLEGKLERPRGGGGGGGGKCEGGKGVRKRDLLHLDVELSNRGLGGGVGGEGDFPP